MRRDYDEVLESEFFALFQRYYDLERDANKQHDCGNYSLSRMYPLAELAGNPERELHIVHVAGTKGKGSTAHFISGMLGAAGLKAGLFTSPHLATVRERFQLDNRLASYEKLLDTASWLRSRLEKAGLEPSLFEIFTLLALRLFVVEGMSWAVIETGIGGRLDATNYIAAPRCTVITPLSFDHQALLGKSIEEIAAEKAGILKPGVPLVLAKQPYAAAEELILQKAKELGVAVHRPTALPPKGLLPEKYPGFLQDNFSVALKVMELLELKPDWNVFQLPKLRARCELLRQEPPLILDAAHNGDSMQKLVASLKQLYPNTMFTVVLGAVKGKNLADMLEALLQLPAQFVLTNPHSAKESALPELEACAKRLGLPVLASIEKLERAEQLPEGPLLFTGSFFTALIGEEIFGGGGHEETLRASS